jgi:sugar phosphate permease
MCFYLLTSAVAIVGIGFSTTPGAIFAWLVASALVGGIGGGYCYAIAQIYAGPEAAGTFVGIMNGLGNTSGIVGPILTGVLVEQTGSYMSAFVVSSVIVGIGAIWWWFALPSVRRLELAFA